MDSLYFYQRSSAVGINKNKNWLNVEKLIGGHHYFLFLFIPSFKIRDYHCAGQIYMSNFTLLCCCMHWKYLWKPKILWFFSYISTSIELFASFLRYHSIVKWLLCCYLYLSTFHHGRGCWRNRQHLHLLLYLRDFFP